MDQKFIDLFDRYTHGGMPRREFLERLSRLAGSAAAAAALLPLLENNYALAEMVPETDPRITAESVTFPSEVGPVGGYLARPARDGRYGAVIVVHENRGLNAHIKDVARRLAVEGFLALAPDFLSLAGGTPEDEDKARDLIAALKSPDVVAMAKGALAMLKERPDSTGRVAAVGFCWGGGQTNQFAVAEPELAGAVVYYGAQPTRSQVRAIQAPLLLHYAGLDERINAGIPNFETALKEEGKSYEIYKYEGVNHAFNNDTNAARYDKEAADLAWSRTIAFLRKHTAA